MTTTNPATPTGTTSSPRPGVLARVLRALPALTLLAVLTITASAEYALARTVLDLPPQIAWALPAAIDSYVLAALHTRRDVPAAITVMAGALLASMGAHLAQVGRTEHLPVTWTAPLATAIMTVLVIVAWRVHVLIGPQTHVVAPDAPAEAAVSAASARSEPAAVPGDHAPSVLAEPAPVLGPVSAAQPSAREAVPGGPSSAPPRLDQARVAFGPRAAAVAATPARTAAPTTVTSRTRTANDEQILAAIGDQTPSIRALMRDHGIGQARATRLHRTIHARRTETTTNQTTTSSSAEDPVHEHDTEQSPEDQNQPETRRAAIQDTRNETTEESENQNTDTRTDEHQNRITNKEQSDTHTCITDRMGESRSPKNGVDHGLVREFPGDSGDIADFADVPLHLAAADLTPAPGVG